VQFNADWCEVTERPKLMPFHNVPVFPRFRSPMLPLAPSDEKYS
jgi:hypothetical protein